MSKTARVPVTCLIVCLLAGPWSSAFAAGREDVTATPATATPVASGTGIRLSAAAFAAESVDNPVFSLAPAALNAKGRQAVATTNEPKLLIGLAAGAAIVGGVGLLAYSATSSCKGTGGDATSSCDKKAMIGALSLSSGIVTLIVWALSRP